MYLAVHTAFQKCTPSAVSTIFFEDDCIRFKILVFHKSSDETYSANIGYADTRLFIVITGARVDDRFMIYLPFSMQISPRCFLTMVKYYDASTVNHGSCYLRPVKNSWLKNNFWLMLILSNFSPSRGSCMTKYIQFHFVSCTLCRVLQPNPH